MSSSIKSKAIDIERKALKYEFNKASLPVKKRLHERLVQLAVSHPKLTKVEVHEIALKDPKYIKDELLLEGLLELYKAADKKLQAKEGATKVGSGLFEGKTSHEDILKALEELKHDKDGAEHHKPSLSAAKVHHTVHPKPHLPRPKPHLVHPHPHPLVKPHLVHHNASASHNLGKPSGGWAALFAKFRTKQPEHAAVKEDDGAGVASSWVSATSVGVVVAMCACVAAFAVVRRRQRQSESAAPRADGYATLV